MAESKICLLYTSSYNQAIRRGVKELADSGLKTVNYESGHVNSIDVAVRRAVMTGVNALCQKYAEQSLDYLETDLVEAVSYTHLDVYKRQEEA